MEEPKDKSALKRSMGSKRRSHERARDDTKKSAGSGIMHTGTEGGPAAQDMRITLADWRRTGVSASHTGLSNFPEDGSQSARTTKEDNSAPPKRRIVSSELPLHTEHKSGHLRPLEIPRRIRSTSGSDNNKSAA